MTSLKAKILVSAILLLFAFGLNADSQAQRAPVLFQHDIDDDRLTKKQSDVLTKYQQNNAVKSVHFARVHDLSILENANSVILNVSDKQQFVAKLFRKDHYGEDNYAWNAHLPDMNGSAVLVVNNGELRGIIRANKILEYYEVSSLGAGLYAIVTVDPLKLGPDESEEAYERMKQKDSIKSTAQSAAKQQKETSLSSTITFDIAVFYTDDARSGAGGTSAIESAIQAAISELSTIYSNSQSGLDADLVYMEEIAFNESGNSATDLNTFMNNQNVHYKRDRYNADIAIIIVEDSNNCGQADQIDADYDDAFAIVLREGNIFCLTSNKSLSHEVGHLQGVYHDNVSASPSYARGYSGATEQTGNYRTVMAVFDSGVPRIPYFSNPDVTASGLGVTGSASRDAVRRMEETDTYIADFETYTTFSMSIGGPSCIQEGSNGYFSGHPSGGFGLVDIEYEYMRLCEELSSPEGSNFFDVPCNEWTYAGSGDAMYFGYQQGEDFLFRALGEDEDSSTDVSSSQYVEVRPFAEGPCGAFVAENTENSLSAKTGEVEQTGTTPTAFSLGPNYPNPFNPTTQIKFSLPEEAKVRLVIYDMLGRQVDQLVNAVLPAGSHLVNWEAHGVPSGAYLYQIQAGDFIQTKRMLLLK